MGYEGRDFFKGSTDKLIVVDNSVAMRWLVASKKSKDQHYALTVRDTIQSESLCVLVPYLWSYEAGHVVAAYANRGDISKQLAIDTLAALEEYFTIVIARESPKSLAEFSMAHGLSAYDAAYVMLAQQESAQLATLDRNMRKVAKKLDVVLFDSGNGV